MADRELLLHIDTPPLVGDTVLGTVSGALILEGWALAENGVASIDVAVDGAPIGVAYYGIRRIDIAAAFPDRNGADRSGFGLIIPAAVLQDGRRRVRVLLRAKDGGETETAFSIDVSRAPVEAGPSVLRRKMPRSEIALDEAILAGLGWRPNFHLFIGIGEVDEEVELARRTLASLRDQAYGAWRATVLRRGRTLPADFTARLRDGLDGIADRIELALDAVAGASLAELALRKPPGLAPQLVGFLLAGDALSCDALLEMAIASGRHPEAELLYSDERRVSPSSSVSEAFFKPQWSPELLTATNYIGRLCCVSLGTLGRTRVSVGDWFQYGDYELVLRCTEAARDLLHVPKVLCERGRPWLDHPEQERQALIRALCRRGISGEVIASDLAGHFRVKRRVEAEKLVSIIIATRAAGGLVKTCVESLRQRTAYRHFEIICVENIAPEDADWRSWLECNTDRVIAGGEPFNWSRFNNLAAHSARGDLLLFLNDDVEIIEPGWLDALIEHAQRPEIGVVGARLLYPDRKVQHAGIFWTPPGGRHAFRLTGEAEPGYFGLSLSERNVLAVTGACLMTRREEFVAQGGFDEGHSIINNDVDYCLRSWERGKRVVYTPHAVLIHHELASRHTLGEDFDVNAFQRRWGRRLRAGDPYYHPNLSRYRDDYAAEPEAEELVYSAHPLFAKSEIRNILVVKLDHLGDFITSVPALRRLRELFPEARLHLLAAPSVAKLAKFVPEIAEIFEFEFFFARSGLGQREISIDDLHALRQRLEPCRFDLAVDLRKWSETRPLLRWTGARWFAGFDNGRQFTWLDIAVAWEPDRLGTRKQTHISEDFLRLIEAVGDAAEPVPGLADFSDEATSIATPSTARRRLVCVHPGVGSPIRQWPAAYFARLIDLLAATHDLDIALIGSAEEAEIAEEVISKVQRLGAVRSLVGKVALADLPQLLAGAALFVGNNSGPQHLAAALGVPTVGIHSGTVDAREWGPLGASAVAIRRDMNCSPCYISDAADCPRKLACLVELRPFAVYELCDRMLAMQSGLPR